MNKQIRSLLLPFYFGAIDDQSRLAVERELLSDEEILVDYLDLKRKIEAAAEVPQGPRASLWVKLQQHVQPRRKLYLSFAFGTAIAASLVILTIMILKTNTIEIKPDSGNEILFDSNHELPASSNVL